MINYVSWNGLGKYRSGCEGTRHCDLQKLTEIAAAPFWFRPQATSDFLLRHRILRSQHLSLAALRRALCRPTSFGVDSDTVKMDHDAAPHAPNNSIAIGTN